VGHQHQGNWSDPSGGLPDIENLKTTTTSPPSSFTMADVFSSQRYFLVAAVSNKIAAVDTKPENWRH
jgi:hypothetical protein